MSTEPLTPEQRESIHQRSQKETMRKLAKRWNIHEKTLSAAATGYAVRSITRIAIEAKLKEEAP